MESTTYQITKINRPTLKSYGGEIIIHRENIDKSRIDLRAAQVIDAVLLMTPIEKIGLSATDSVNAHPHAANTAVH
jgi:hypothetical protein